MDCTGILRARKNGICKTKTRGILRCILFLFNVTEKRSWKSDTRKDKKTLIIKEHIGTSMEVKFMKKSSNVGNLEQRKLSVCEGHCIDKSGHFTVTQHIS